MKSNPIKTFAAGVWSARNHLRVVAKDMALAGVDVPTELTEALRLAEIALARLDVLAIGDEAHPNSINGNRLAAAEALLASI